jgi:hypothetical protein
MNSLWSRTAAIARSSSSFSSTSPGSNVMNCSASFARKASISASTSGMSTTWLIGKDGYTRFMSGLHTRRKHVRVVIWCRPRLTI